MSTVSVIIPAYNQGHYLGEAVQSVVDQTYQDFEVIIVDDGSTDNTREVVESFRDSRIRYIYQENRGLPAARNSGMRNSSGQYLTYLDSDDLFLPQKLALLVGFLEREPEIGLVAGQTVLINATGQRVGKVFDARLPKDGAQLLLGNPISVGSVMLRRSWQERVGFFDESLPSYEDWDMWLRLVRAGCKTGWIPQPVYLYRFHQSQMTRQGAQMTTATFAVLDKIFCDPTLPEGWREMRDRAYSNAYLRAAAQAYHAGDLSSAKISLSKAVQLNPDLIADNAGLLAQQFAAWTDSPKARDPLVYLESIYNNLPSGLSLLGQRRRQDLGRAAMQLAFESYRQGDLATARSATWRAFRYQPGWLRNRGAVSIFIRSWLRIPGQGSGR